MYYLCKMKKLLFFLSIVFLMSCEPEMCKCTKVFSMTPLMPEIFYVTDCARYDGKTGIDTDQFGNVKSYTIKCE